MNINIGLDYIILDKLHLLLRIVDVLLNNLLEDVLQWDKKDDLNKKRGEKKGVHCERLQAAVCSCVLILNFLFFLSVCSDKKKQVLNQRYECYVYF